MANLKFTNMNLLDVMGGIVRKHVRAYREDFDVDRDILRDAAVEPSEQDRRFVWLVRPTRTWLLKERNAFLKGTRENNTIAYYAEHSLIVILAKAW